MNIGFTNIIPAISTKHHFFLHQKYVTKPFLTRQFTSKRNYIFWFILYKLCKQIEFLAEAELVFCIQHKFECACIQANFFNNKSNLTIKGITDIQLLSLLCTLYILSCNQLNTTIRDSNPC